MLLDQPIIIFIKMFIAIILYHMVNIGKHVISTLKSHYYLTCGTSPPVIEKFKQLTYVYMENIYFDFKYIMIKGMKLVL